MNGNQTTSNPQDPQKYLPSVNKESFKAIFYMMSGKPDSKTRVFNKRKICITRDDIINLNTAIHDKLRLHSVEMKITQVNMSFSDNTFKEFGTWVEFTEHIFKVPEVTTEMSIRWDFMVKIDSYQIPQRHTMVVKIAKRPNPKDMFQIMMSKDADDDKLDVRMSLCMARVDFINHRLAQELLNIVEEWNKAAPVCDLGSVMLLAAKPHELSIARFIHWSIPVCVLVVVLCYIGNYVSESAGMSRMSQVTILSFFIIFVSERFSHYLAVKTIKMISAGGEYAPFKITSGDENCIKEMTRGIRSKVMSFSLTSLLAIIINVISAIICIAIGFN